MQEQRKIDDIAQSVKKYAATNVELIKLEAIEKSALVGSSFLSSMILGVVIFLFLLFTSLSAGFYISARMGDTYSGFLIVSGFYLILCILLLSVKDKIIEKPVRDLIIRKMFS